MPDTGSTERGSAKSGAKKLQTRNRELFLLVDPRRQMPNLPRDLTHSLHGNDMDDL